LQQQLFERIEAAQRMTGDSVSQTRSQHDELLLPFVLRRADGAANRIVETAQLALGARIHIAHAADYAVRLIVEIQRIGDQFFDIDFRRAFETATVATATPVVTSLASATFAATLRTTPAFPISRSPAFAPLALWTLASATLRTIPLRTISLRTVALLRLALRTGSRRGLSRGSR
jgi:hypothetical protein